MDVKAPYNKKLFGVLLLIFGVFGMLIIMHRLCIMAVLLIIGIMFFIGVAALVIKIHNKRIR